MRALRLLLSPSPRSCTLLALSLPMRGANGFLSTKCTRYSRHRLFLSSDARQTPEEVQMTADCKKIFSVAIQAVNPSSAIDRHVRRSGSTLEIGVGNDCREYNLDEYSNVLVVGFGKASSAMTATLIDKLSDVNVRGVVIVKDGHVTDEEQDKLQAANVVVRAASHPVPDQRSVDASKELLRLVADTASEETLVLACISGGGSALFCAPSDRLTLDDLQATNTALLQSGLSITDMNVVRKRLELGKGGRLAAQAYPGRIVSLILSDVLGDPLDLIASGPTVADSSTWQDAWSLVQSRMSKNKLPAPVMDLLRDGIGGKVEDSPSADHPIFSRCFNCLVGNNPLVVKAAADQAQQLGYHPVILGAQMEGEASQVARFVVGMAQHLRQGSPDFAVAKLPAALIFGGETTVTLPSDCAGKGGRNQELALEAARLLKAGRLRQIVLASIGTDGNDGPTAAAGAMVDGGTIDRLPGDVVDALARHDAYPYLAQQDDQGLSPLVIVSPIIMTMYRSPPSFSQATTQTGPTGANVADVCITLVYEREEH